MPSVCAVLQGGGGGCKLLVMGLFFHGLKGLKGCLLCSMTFPV